MLLRYFSNAVVSRLESSVLFLLFLLFAVAARANVCTPLNLAANGPFPAIVNGIDALDWGVARIQWTSDATSATPATEQRIQYATAAQWAANPAVYPQTQGLQPITVTSNTIFQGAALPNLRPGTTYHVIGQSYQGGAWCAATDQTFTTLPYPGIVTPTLPQTFSTTVPTVTGTNWTYGGNCGVTGTVTQKLQDCFNKAQPGDGIGLPPGTYNTGQIFIPYNPLSQQVSSVSTSMSTITSPSHGLSNGQQIHFGAQGYLPSPLNMGVTYKVLNATANTFQVSYDGVNPITFINAGNGATIFFEKWPLTQNYIYVHSIAPSSALPPAGVRLDPVAYGASLPNIQASDPSRIMLSFSELSSYYWFQNVEFSTDPSVAAASGNGVDPPNFTSYLGTAIYNDHIVFNQCAIVPAPPPSRSQLITFDGSNIGYLNSYITGLDFWQPFRNIGGATIGTSTVSLPAGSYSWVGSGGVKQSCAVSSSTLTVTGTGNFYIYVDPTNCHLDAQIQTGMTATGNMNVSTVSSPGYPTYDYTSTGGYTYILRNVLPIANGSAVGGVLNAYSDSDGASSQDSESGDGLHAGSGPGPYMVVNNYIQGSGVTGTFLSDDLTNQNSPCGTVNPCAVQYNTGNLTEQRNTITTNPCYFAGNPCWNGGNYYWRNLTEVKQGKYVLQDGNIYGPYYAQVAQGDCGSAHFTYTAGFPTGNGYANYADSSEWNFTNNTCYETGEGAGSATNYLPAGFPYPMRDLRIHNNLFYNMNAYAQTSATQPFGAVVVQSNAVPNCPYGKLLQWGGDGENFQFDHNTIYGQGGCLTWFWDQFITLSSGMTFSNNIFNLIDDPGVYADYLTTGTYFQNNQTFGGTADNPSCAGYQASALLACLTQSTWAGNVMLATWTNSFPGSQVDYTNSQIASAQALFPANTYWPSAGTTLADRINQIAWYSPSQGNLRLKSSSPYIGGHTSTDFLDIGVDMDALEAAQGKVSNVRSYNMSSTATTIGFLAPDSFGCSVDWGTENFVSGTGSFTRVLNAGGQRVQSVTLTGLPADSYIYYRVNCAVQQPSGLIQLP